MVVLCASPCAYADNTCLKGGCHKAVAELAKPHTALKTGCSSCHKAADHKRKRFVLVATGKRLCKLCHSWPKKLKTPHSAFEYAECTLCHDPHGSANKALLKKWPTNTLCEQCHPQWAQKKHQHDPFAKGDCTGCHNAHGSNQPGMLHKEQKSVCADCHKTETNASFSGAYKHQPFEQGRCDGCHNPHQSSFAHLVRKEGSALCADCHVKYPKLKQRHSHDAMEQGCPTCHKPHAAKSPKLLGTAQPKLCYGCHDRKDEDKVVHSAIKLGRCSGCHDAHGSRHETLLHAGRLGDVCFRCHCDDVTRRMSVHWPVKGKVCDRCHGSHGSSQPNLLTTPVRDLCKKCHADKEIPKDVNGHGGQVQAGCAACHDAHASSAPRLLKKPINALCSTCHTKQRNGEHIFVGPRGKGHPVSNKPDPLHVGRVLSCISCHAMSSSRGPKMLRADSRAKLCRRCHEGGMGKIKKPGKKRQTPTHHFPTLIPRRSLKAKSGSKANKQRPLLNSPTLVPGQEKKAPVIPRKNP
ncbi:MAG: hypothetical protein JRH20_15370 [Deltaproteobacteria bacterium]|nr:hypothetical protein [Deltaproteobacteria bacterium]